MFDWYGKKVLKQSDVDGLELSAAHKEFVEGASREDAEEAAYQEYTQKQHQAAAAHHLRGMRAAQASGDLSEAALHGEGYYRHMHALGHDPIEQVPDDIKNLVESEEKTKHYKFKPHAADNLL